MANYAAVSSRTEGFMLMANYAAISSRKIGKLEQSRIIVISLRDYHSLETNHSISGLISYIFLLQYKRLKRPDVLDLALMKFPAAQICVRN